MTGRILVAGATGTIGRPLLQALHQRGAPVVAGSREGKPVDGVPGQALDLLDPASTAEALRGIERLFLLTPAHPEMAQMTANAVAAAKAAGVRHVVRLSGAGADPASPAAIARLQGNCDQLVIDSGIPYTLLRPKNFMQNFTSFMNAMVRAGTVYSSQEEGRIPFIDAGDIAEAAAAVLFAPEAHSGQAYTLTGPQALTNAEALAMIAQAIGRPVQLVSIDEAQAVAGMRSSGMPEALVEVMSSLNQIIAAGSVAEVTGDLPRLLGRPATPFADFVRVHRQAWL